jgi:hypothetical protein
VTWRHKKDFQRKGKIVLYVTREFMEQARPEVIDHDRFEYVVIDDEDSVKNINERLLRDEKDGAL